jgi:hypothetical protein
MHQLGLSAADVAVIVHKAQAEWKDALGKFEAAAVHAGHGPEEAKTIAMVHYLHDYTTALLEANNRKIAADLIRLGVLTGTIDRDGQPAF